MVVKPAGFEPALYAVPARGRAVVQIATIVGPRRLIGQRVRRLDAWIQ